MVVRAAGAVLWRPAPDGTAEVALVHRPRYDDWSLPKGKLDPGEGAAAAAAREVREETGFSGRLGRALGTSSYDVLADGTWTPKTVQWWSARCTSGSFTPNREVDALLWLPVEQAQDRLTAGRDRAVLEAFSAHPPDTTSVVLVRHACAGTRADWDGEDALRPLDARGREQALLLADLLVLHGARRVLSAAPLRCVQTVQPLADRLGVPVEPVPLLSDTGHRAAPDAARALVAGLEDGTVACSQGEALPALLQGLSGPLAGGVPAQVPKGGGQVLSLHRGRLVQADPLVLPGTRDPEQV